MKRAALISALALVLIAGSAFQVAAVSGSGNGATQMKTWEIKINGQTEPNPIVPTSTPLIQAWANCVGDGLSINFRAYIDGVQVGYKSGAWASGLQFTLYIENQLTKPLAEGSHQWKLSFYHGHWGTEEVYTGSFVVDTVPPVAQGIQINGGAAYTTSTSVALNLNASDATSGLDAMQFSLDGTNWSDWESWSTSKALSLPSGDGPKTVHFRVKDKASHVSNAKSATITLDQAAPSIASFQINGGADYTSSTSASLGISASDATSGLDAMQFSLDGTNWSDWENYSNSKSLTLPAGDGQKTVWVKIKDKAGNAVTKSATITLDQTPPVVGAVTPSVTNSESVTLDLSSSSDALAEIAWMKVWLGGESEPAGWEAFTVSKQVTLSAGDGVKKIYVRLRDAVGNESAPKEVSTTLDKTPPSIQVLEPSSSEIIGNKLKVKANLSDMLAGLDASSIEALINGVTFENVAFENGVLSFEMELPHGTHSIQLKAKDLAGNLASKSLFVVLKPQPQTPSQPSQPAQPQPTITMTVPERVNGDRLRVTIRVSNPTSSPIVKRLVLRFNGNELPLEFGVQPGEELVHDATLDVPPNAVGTFAVVLADAESGSTVASGNVTLGAVAPSDERQAFPASSPGVPAYLLALAVVPPVAVAAVIIHKRASRVPRQPKRASPTTQPRTRSSSARPAELVERMKIHRRYREHPD